MAEKPKEIWEYKACEVRKFFLSNEGYFNFDMPSYIDFDKLLGELHSKIECIDKRLQGKKLGELRKEIRSNEKIGPKTCDNINYTLFINKSNKYTWRPCEFIHPALYVSLAHEITRKESWSLICERLEQFSNNKTISCYSLPIPVSGVRRSKAKQIRRWWDKIEQRSIELSLRYNYMIRTDISDCYSSIYTHSIAWAIHSRFIAKRNRNNFGLIGNVIDRYMQDMNQGQTNGIPQGSRLTDFIAEIVLGYLDLKLAKKIKADSKAGKIKNCEILRYRDDYRIFVNNKEFGERITRLLAEVAVDLGFSLNPTKTKASDEVIQDSIKQDKLAWILQSKDEKELEKQLLVIHDHSRRFPDAGSFMRPLEDYHRRIYRIYRFANLKFIRAQQSSTEPIEPSERPFKSIVEWNLRRLPKNTSIYRDLSALRHPQAIISIVVDIAYNNPRTYPICAVILGILINFLDNIEDRRDVLKQIRHKFEQRSKNGHLEIWLQRISHREVGGIDYKEKICKIVSQEYEPIWNVEWLNDELKRAIKDKGIGIIHPDKLNKASSVASPREIALCMGEYYG